MNILMRVVGVFLVFVGIFILFSTWCFTGLVDPSLPPDQRWGEQTSQFFHSDGLPFGLAAIAAGVWFFAEGRRKPADNPSTAASPTPGVR